MYKKLHRHLTFLFTGIAGAILIAMSFSYLYMSEKELNENSLLTFSSKINSLTSNLKQQDTLTWEWLSKNSADQNFILAFYDNEIPLTYNQTVLSAEEHRLTDDAMAYAKSAFPSLKSSSDYSAAHQEFSYASADNKNYYASVLNIPKNSGTLTGIILSSKKPLTDQISTQRLRFLFLNIAGIFILFLFSWYYTGKLLAPVIEARQKQTAFVAAASHELRTPIAVICSALSAAKSTESSQKDHFFHIAQNESLRMSALVDDLLLLSRADTGRFALELQPVELDTLLLDTFESFWPLAKEHEMNLQITLPEDAIPCCSCDGKRIQQVLGILISNAISYGGNGKDIELELKYRNDTFEITVKDHGAGIADKDKPYIFDRFYRAEDSRSAKEHFGLGLCIAKEITEAHGGHITLKDTAGVGADFRVFLRRDFYKPL